MAVQPGTDCHHCGRQVLAQRLTVPRAKSGDLVFCGWDCQERWRAALGRGGR